MKPLGRLWCLPEEVLEASGASSFRHQAFPMDPGEGQELREQGSGGGDKVVLGPGGGGDIQGQERPLAPVGLTAKHLSI